MTDAEILQAMNQRLAQLPGTRSPELHQILAAMLSVMRRMDERLRRVEPARESDVLEGVVTEVVPVLKQTGQPTQSTPTTRNRLTAATRSRVKRSRQFP